MFVRLNNCHQVKQHRTSENEHEHVNGIRRKKNQKITQKKVKKNETEQTNENY